MLLQIPGGPELLITFLVAIVLFGVPLVLVTVAAVLYLRRQSDDEEVAERIADLEGEIAQLRADLDETSADDGNDD